MKKTFFSFIFAILAFTSFAQKIRFSDTTNVWREIAMYDWPPDYNDYECRYQCDTIRGGIKYQILRGSVWTSGEVLIREDTSASKVYVTILGGGCDSTEHVLYDYDWQVGDTIIRDVREHYVHVISAIDSTLANSIWHKVWHFQAISASSGSSSIGTKNFDVIEGIGCTDDPIFSLFPMNFEAASKLYCFSDQFGTPSVNPKVSGYFDNGSSCTLGANQFTKKKEALIIPNPVGQTSKIILPSNILSGALAVINDVGQTVFMLSFQNKEEISIGDKIKVPGMYYYRVTDIINNIAFSGKFVKQ